MPEHACGWTWTSLVRGTPHTAGQSWRAGACFLWGVLRTRTRPEAGLYLRAVSDVEGEEPHGPCIRALPGPGGGQAFLPQAPHTGRGGKRPRRVRDEDPDPLPVGRAQPGPQGRRRGALIEEVSDEDTSETRGAGRMEQRGPCCCSSTALACACCAAMA